MGALASATDATAMDTVGQPVNVARENLVRVVGAPEAMRR